MANPNVSHIGAYLKAVPGTVPTRAEAGTRNGPVIDRMGYSSCVLAVSTGAVAGAPSAQSLAAKLQHGDAADGSDMADFTPPDGIGTGATAPITAANASAERDVNLGGAKRYVRVVETVAFTGGTSPTLDCASLLVLGGAATKPAA